jgi:uncharacterized protein (TIGR03437 family)
MVPRSRIPFIIKQVFFSSLLASALFAQPSRIHGAIDNTRRFALAGHVRPQVSAGNDRGAMDSETRISNVTLAFEPTSEQQTALEQLLARQQTPGSPDYHRWLTPDEYAERFGLNAGDFASIRQWLEAQGLTVTNTARSRTWIAVSGTAGQMESAFQTKLHHYESNGELHFANATNPTVPAQFSGIVRAIRGLNDFHAHPLKHALRKRDANPQYTSTRGNHYLAPSDLATIYNFSSLYAAGINGAGQRIVIAGQTQINLADLRQFRSQYGLPAADPQVILTPGTKDPGVSKDDADEAHLDLEWSGAAAPGATQIYVYAPDVFTAVQYAIDQNLAPVISTSYGSCELELSTGEANTMRGWARQANAQGITWFSASGDTGGADCSYIGNSSLSVDIPGSIPEVTSVGGTTFQEGTGAYWGSTNSSTRGSVLSYLPEVAWNDSVADGEPSSTGGGTSRFFAKPDWQTGPGVPGDTARHVPDVSMSASADHDGYMVYSQGADAVFGGTSVPTPIYAGLTALLNQYLVAKGVQSTAGLGNLNPNFYSLARSSSGIFHDITSGDNIVTVTCPARSRTCTTATVGYSAGPGYDQVTGLGSVDAYMLVTGWAGTSGKAMSSSQLSLQTSMPLVRAGDTVLLIATASSSDGSTPSGPVVFTEGGAQLGSASLVGSAGAATATLAVAASKLSQGSGTITATWNGSQSATVTLSASSDIGTAATPSISGIANAGSFTTVYAPGEIVSIFGSNLASEPQVANTVPLPRVLAGVAVTVNGIAAPVWYVSAGQINFQIPYEVAAGSTATVTVNSSGQTGSSSITLASAAPGIFTDSANTIAPAGTAARGDFITLYITGAGQVSPAIASGAAPAGNTSAAQLPTPQQSATVTIGNVTAPVSFVGIPSGLVGVLQVNFQVPSTVAAGTQPVVVTVGGIASKAATLTIAR